MSLNWGYKRRYYYKSLCNRICRISLYFTDLNIPNSNCGKRFRASAQPHSHDRMGGLISRRTPVHAPWKAPILHHAAITDQPICTVQSTSGLRSWGSLEYTMDVHLSYMAKYTRTHSFASF